MQTTLLGIAIALILALVAALVGPWVVDMERFRPSIEAEASRLVGAPVRVTGPIEAALLPSPSLVLRGLEIGPSHASSSVRMRSLGVELNLGALVRGEWRAQQLHLVGPDFHLGIDGSGNLALPPIAPGFDPDRLSIEKLNIEDGHAVLMDSRSGGRVTLDKLSFNGDVRSLAGPFRGDGAAVIGGDLYAYRVSGSRVEEGAMRLRLNIDPLEKPLAVEADGILSFPAGAPRYEGGLTMSRPAGIALPSGQTVSSDPWRFTGKVKATSASALFEGIEFQYGPDERAIRLAGTAELKFGEKPRFDGVLAATQLDLDRAFPSPGGRPLPFAALKSLGDSFTGALRPPVPARIGVSVDALTVAGATIQTLRGDLRTDGEAWNLDGFEMRVPGYTQVNLSGKLELAPGRLAFTGPVSVDSTDPSALVAWLEGSSTLSATRMKPFRARAEVTLGSEKIAFDRLRAEVDRKWVEGRFGYVWAAAGKPARLDADLNAPELDIDALLAFADAARGSTTFEAPGEITVGLGIGRAVVAGLSGSDISARFRRDASGLYVEKLAVGNIGGNAFDASGRIDATASPPRGTLAMRFDGRNMAGVATLAEKFLPEAANWVRRLSQRMPQAQLNATLALEQDGAGRLGLDGRAGDTRVAFRAETARAAAAISDLAKLPTTDVKLEARVDADKGNAVVDLLNLGGVIAVDPARPGQLSITANGPLNNLQFDGRLVAAGLDAAAKGTAQLRLDAPKADLRLTLANADLRPLRPKSARPDPLPVSLTGKLRLKDNTIALDDFTGTVAGVPARGKLAFDFASATKVEGRIETDMIDGPTTLATLTGAVPSPDVRKWSAEPFGKGALGDMEGRVEFRAARASLSPSLTLQQARGALKFSPAQIGFADVQGTLAGGQAQGEVSFQKRDNGLLTQARLKVSNADAAALFGGEGKPAVTGRVTVQADVEGMGLSPQTLIGSLAGDGIVSLSQAQFAALNPNVFEITTRAVDQGAPLDVKKIGEIATAALDSGVLKVPSAESVVTIANGQIRLTNLVTRTEGAELTVSGSVDVGTQNLNARLALLASTDELRGASEQPAISISLNGPMAGPKRTVDVSTLTAWLTLRAVEHQSKQLEAIEKRRASVSPGDDARSIMVPAPTTAPAAQPPVTTPQTTAPYVTVPAAPAPSIAAPPIYLPPVQTPAMPGTPKPPAHDAAMPSDQPQALAPPLPPAIDVPTLPNIMLEQKPGTRAPARAQTGTAAQPRSGAAGRPLPLLPTGPDN